MSRGCRFLLFLKHNPVDNFGTVVGENALEFYHCGLSMDYQLSAGKCLVTLNVLINL